MKVLFWNTNGNNVIDVINELKYDNEFDVLILIEANLNPNSVLLVLNRIIPKYQYAACNFCEGIQIYAKFSSKLINPFFETKRHSARKLIIPQLNKDFLLIVIHYQSKLRWSDANQSAHSIEIGNFIAEAENRIGHNRTIVLGDFNMNPFEFGMVQTTGLHATMSKQIALEEKRIVDGKEYEFFYNPMWSFYGEEGKGNVNGTFFYRKSEPICYFWNIIDQVLLKANVLEYFDEKSLSIITETSKRSLLKAKGRIDTTISDHLPVFFKLKF